MVINLIHVCSNNGELRLEPTLFPDEAAFFQDPDILRWPIEVRLSVKSYPPITS
jgi:hypothetical protein